MSIELTDTQANDWLSRLEDPETRRFENRLRSTRDSEAMCCLGHLGDIIDPEAWAAMANGAWKWGNSVLSLPEVTYRGVELDQNALAVVNDAEHRFPVAEVSEWIRNARELD